IDQAVAAAIAGRAEPVAIPVLALDSNSPLIEVSLLFDAGAAYDPPGKAGLAALTAAMISQGGTARRSFEELQQAFYPLASGLQAQVDKRMLRLSGSIHRDNLDTWYGLVREMLLEPGLREDDFQRLKQLQINAVRVNLRGNNDEELAKEVLYETVYGADHPYGRLNAGHAGDLESITLDDVRGYFADAFTAQRVRIGLSGPTGDAFVQQLVADLNRLGHGQAPALDVGAPEPAAQRQAIVIEKETPAVAVSFGWPIDVRRGHADWPALWLLRSYLGEHRNSSALLYQRIREQRGMNYGNYAYIEYFPNGMFLTSPEPNYARDNDLFQIWLRPLRDNNDALFATRAALFELQRLRDDGIPEDRFEATRDFLMKATAINTASGRARLGYAMDSQWFDIPPFLDYVRTSLAALSHEQVNQVIARYLDPSSAQFVFVTRQAAELADALAADTPSPIQYNTDKPAQLLAEDALIAELPLELGSGQIRIVDVETVFE
ncbi:MAG: insulinase family protein, partial [Lysobacterales bacterium]